MQVIKGNKMDRHDQNFHHLMNPSPGDYWEDHLCPVCVVLGVSNFSITICRDTKQIDDMHWYWDLSKITHLTLTEFRKFLLYNSKNLKNKTWATVHPLHHIDAVKEALKMYS